jgi:glycosyltransferase 2 family protein
VQGLGLPFARAAEISLVAHFFNSFLLGTVGGDVMKAYYAARETHHKKTEAVVTVFVDRVVGFWAMLLFASFMIVPNLHLFAQPNLLWNVAGLLVLGTLGASAFVFLAFRGGVSKKWSGARDLLRRLPKADIIERSLDSCREFGKERGFLVRTVGLSMLMNFLCVLQFFILARGLRIDVSLLELCLIVPTIICASALPVSIAGIGVREYLMVHLLAVPAIDADRTGALSLALLAFAGSIAWSLVGGVVYVLFREKHHLAEAELARNEG